MVDKKNYEKRIEKVCEFFKLCPSYLREPNNRIANRTNEFDFGIIDLAKMRLKHKQLIKELTKELGPEIGIHLLMGCNHYPWANMKMEKAILKLIQDLKDNLTGFHILGDFLDLNSLSKHSPNEIPIPGITLDFEYESGNKALDRFEKVLPKHCEKTFMFGNHEDRYSRHMKNVEAAKLGTALLSPEIALNLKKRGYTIYKKWKEDRHELAPNLFAFHGEFCTKYPARAHLDKQKVSGIFVHTHRMDIAFDGENRSMYNIGFAGDKEAECFKYASRHIRDAWVNGFALVNVDENGNSYITVIKVVNGEFMYNGKKY